VNATVTQGAKSTLSSGLFNTKDDHIILLGMSVNGGRAVILGTQASETI
jgi:hypothetical protein